MDDRLAVDRDQIKRCLAPGRLNDRVDVPSAERFTGGGERLGGHRLPARRPPQVAGKRAESGGPEDHELGPHAQAPPADRGRGHVYGVDAGAAHHTDDRPRMGLKGAQGSDRRPASRDRQDVGAPKSGMFAPWSRTHDS